jgi:hypothetical protein
LEHVARPVHDNISLLVDAPERCAPRSLSPAGDLIADAERVITGHTVPAAERRHLELAVRHLDQLDVAILRLARRGRAMTAGADGARPWRDRDVPPS